MALTGGALHGDEGQQGLRHWEIASADPDRIMLTFMGDPATGRAVTWRTDASVTTGLAEIAPGLAEPRFDRKARRFEAKTEVLDLGAFPENRQGLVHFHSVVFDDLQPDTLYAYRVGNEDGYWSEWIQFRTAKRGPGPFQFLYFGDAQNDLLSHWSRVARMAAQIAPDAPIALHAGDLVNEGHRDTEWGEWFKAGGFLHSQWTAIVAAGNHEYRQMNPENPDWEGRVLAMHWRPQFTLPEVPSLPELLQETVYTVDYQGVRFIILNTNRMQEEQIPYLEKKLKEAGPLWRVVAFHHPVFSPGRDRDNAELRAAWKPLFDKYSVDLVLQGHDHTYARGHVTVDRSENFNTLYVTSVSGPKMYDILGNKFEVYEGDGYRHDRQAENTQFFQVISVDGSQLTYEAYTATGELYDKATITKDFVSGTKQIEQEIPDVPRRTHANTERYER